MTSFQFPVVRRIYNFHVHDDIIAQKELDDTHNNIGALMALVTLRGPCITIEVVGGDGVSPALTRTSDTLSLSL